MKCQARLSAVFSELLCGNMLSTYATFYAEAKHPLWAAGQQLSTVAL